MLVIKIFSLAKRKAKVRISPSNFQAKHHFFYKKHKRFFAPETDSVKINHMQKSSRKTTRFPLNFHAMPMDKGLHEGEARKSVKWELAKWVR